MASIQVPTGVKHLCCGEHSPVVPSYYCPFCGKIVREYGVAVDVRGNGEYLAVKLAESGVPVTRVYSF